MSFRKRTKAELGMIYVGMPENLMGCDDEDNRGCNIWSACILPEGTVHSDRRRCNFLDTDKCPHSKTEEEMNP